MVKAALILENASIVLENVGKRFRNDWIFRRLNYTFLPNAAYALLGPNGSGKSTLLQVLSGSLQPSVGKIAFNFSGQTVSPDNVYQQIAWAAPYMELIEELTLAELVQFHVKFKPLVNQLSPKNFLEQIELTHAANKQIRFFSSGMKQRAKLGLAILSDTPILLLDEPTTNLDAKGVAWYGQLIANFAQNRLTIVASNQPHEYQFCTHHLVIDDYKK